MSVSMRDRAAGWLYARQERAIERAIGERWSGTQYIGEGPEMDDEFRLAVLSSRRINWYLALNCPRHFLRIWFWPSTLRSK